MAKPAYALWLAKAKADLSWTAANIREKIYYGACFTAQQAAEKALKAYLLSKGQLPRRIHDLGALLEEAKRFDPSFEELREAAAALTDYYAQTRYPDIAEFVVHDEEQAKEAFSLAEKIAQFVEKRIGQRGQGYCLGEGGD